jgi:hypothetical protein
MSCLRIVVLASFASLPIFALACGDDNGANDSGTDATEPNDSSPDVTKPSDASPSDAKTNDASDGGFAGCPTYDGSVAFCKTIVAHCEACGPSLGACDTAHFQTECEAIVPLLSAEHVAAAAACVSACDTTDQNWGFEIPPSGTCQKTFLADASLTNAAQKVATDYCAKCGDGGACASQISSELDLVDYSDSLSTTLDQDCTPDASAACGTPYFFCALGALGNAGGGILCSDAGDQ